MRQNLYATDIFRKRLLVIQDLVKDKAVFTESFKVLLSLCSENTEIDIDKRMETIHVLSIS